MTGMDATPTPRRQSARLQQFSFVTASCAVIDMGSYMLSECRNRPYTVEDAAQPAISGEHAVQILPHSPLESQWHKVCLPSPEASGARSAPHAPQKWLAVQQTLTLFDRYLVKTILRWAV